MNKIAEPTRGFDWRMAYPQHADEFGKNVIISTDTWIKLQEYVLERVSARSISSVSYTVQQHWNKILSGIVPFDIKIVKPIIGG